MRHSRRGQPTCPLHANPGLDRRDESVRTLDRVLRICSCSILCRYDRFRRFYMVRSPDRERRRAMACNGFNHPPDCVCQFRGGHPGSQPPRPIARAALLGDLAPPALRRPFAERQPGRCRKCGMATFYVPGRRSGNYFAAGDGSFLKHRCPKAVPTELLSNKRAKWKREWFPVKLSVTSRRGGQVLDVLSLTQGAPFRVRVEDGVTLEASKPAVCRWSSEDPRILEIAYVDELSGELTGTCVRALRIGPSCKG